MRPILHPDRRIAITYNITYCTIAGRPREWDESVKNGNNRRYCNPRIYGDYDMYRWNTSLLVFLVQDNIFHKAPHESPFSLVVDIRVSDDVIDGLHTGEYGLLRGLFAGSGGFQFGKLFLEGITYFVQPFLIFFVFF